MRAFVVRGPGRMELVDLPVPVPGPEEVLVKVAYCSVCGTDLTNYDGQVRPARVGRILGHEISGVVADVGERVQDLQPGDRVALEPAIPCRRCWFCQRGLSHMCPDTVHLGSSTQGGFADYVTVHELNAHRVPEEMPLRSAALLEPLGVCLAGLRRVRLEGGETVAVFGDGPFGLAYARLGMILGAREVWVMGHHDWRLERISAPMVRTVNTHSCEFLPMLLGATGGRGVDVAVVATSSPDVYDELLPAMRARGRVLAFSFPSNTVCLDMSQVQMRELEIRGSCRCPHTFETLMDLIGQGRLDSEELVSAVLPLERLPEAFALVRGPEKNLFKVLIQVAEE